MSKFAFRLTYDGPALSEHGMDVADLAPALLSLGELIKQANFLVNGDAAKVNLIVQSDFQHACFQVNLELIQSLYSALASFLDDDKIKSAKDLAEWLGLIGSGGAFVHPKGHPCRIPKEVLYQSTF